jgi:hypothetical protein
MPANDDLTQKQEAIIYNTSWAGVVVILFIGLFIGFALIFSPTAFSGPDLWIPWAYLILILAVAADMKFGIYASIKDGDFFEVKHFIFQRRIAVANIGEIIYQPTWLFGKNMRSLYIVDKVNNRIRIKMTNWAYTLATLASIITRLTSENSAIKLDEPAKQLVDGFASKAKI